MATADDIPADLALEIGDDLDPKKFLAAVREFFGYVESITPTTSSDTRMDWRVKVREGSSILALVPAPAADAKAFGPAYAHIQRATRALVSGDFESAALSDKTLEHARKLSDLTRTKGGVVPMRVWIDHQPILFGPEVGDLIREETRPAYRDYGSLEGTLNAIQDSRGNLEVRIRDPLWQTVIKCFVPEEMLVVVMARFRQRVELFGEIYYRKDDTPESIKVDRLEPLPNDDELPSIDEVRGLFSGGIAAT